MRHSSHSTHMYSQNFCSQRIMLYFYTYVYSIKKFHMRHSSHCIRIIFVVMISYLQQKIIFIQKFRNSFRNRIFLGFHLHAFIHMYSYTCIPGHVILTNMINSLLWSHRASNRWLSEFCKNANVSCSLWWDMTSQ